MEILERCIGYTKFAILLVLLGLSLKVYWWTDAVLPLAAGVLYTTADAAKSLGHGSSEAGDAIRETGATLRTTLYDLSDKDTGLVNTLGNTLAVSNGILYIAQTNLNSRAADFNRILWQRTGEVTADTSKVADLAEHLSASSEKLDDTLGHISTLSDNYAALGTQVSVGLGPLLNCQYLGKPRPECIDSRFAAFSGTVNHIAGDVSRVADRYTKKPSKLGLIWDAARGAGYACLRWC